VTCKHIIPQTTAYQVACVICCKLSFEYRPFYKTLICRDIRWSLAITIQIAFVYKTIICRYHQETPKAQNQKKSRCAESHDSIADDFRRTLRANCKQRRRQREGGRARGLPPAGNSARAPTRIHKVVMDCWKYCKGYKFALSVARPRAKKLSASGGGSPPCPPDRRLHALAMCPPKILSTDELLF